MSLPGWPSAVLEKGEQLVLGADPAQADRLDRPRLEQQARLVQFADLAEVMRGTRAPPRGELDQAFLVQSEKRLGNCSESR